MQNGITPVVAVVLLIALSVVAGVSLYFWTSSITPGPEPTKSAPITVRPSSTEDGRFLVTNAGTEQITLSELLTSETGVTCDFNETMTITGGGSKGCYMSPKAGESVSLYANDDSGRSVGPFVLSLNFDEVPNIAFFLLGSTLTYAVNDVDGLIWVALKENASVVANNTISGCDTFYTNKTSSYTPVNTYSVWYKDCEGITESKTYS